MKVSSKQRVGTVMEWQPIETAPKGERILLYWLKG